MNVQNEMPSGSASRNVAGCNDRPQARAAAATESTAKPAYLKTASAARSAATDKAENRRETPEAGRRSRARPAAQARIVATASGTSASGAANATNQTDAASNVAHRQRAGAAQWIAKTAGRNSR